MRQPEHYGASAPYQVIFEQFGFTPDSVIACPGHAVTQRSNQGQYDRQLTQATSQLREATCPSKFSLQLSDAGVALWLDDISRDRLATGNLEALIRDKHIVGVTSNPTIFQKAITGSELYDQQVRPGVTARHRRRGGPHDYRPGHPVGVTSAPVYDASDGVDGRVSYEVDPRLAHDTETTIAEARQLWWP